MINLVLAELYKLKKSNVFKVCLLITTICAVLLAVLTNQIAKGNVDIPTNTLSGLSDIFIMSVLGPLIAGFLICNDFETKNIHDEISCGRFAIVFSKGIIYTIMIMLVVLPYAVVTLVGFLSGGDFGSPFAYSTYVNILANQAGYAINAENVVKVIIILFTSLLLYAARLSICIPIAFKTRKAVVVTVIGVIFGFVVDLICTSLADVPLIGDILEYTPFTHNVVEMDFGYSEIIKIIIISVIFILLMILLTYKIFKKSEIK